MRGEQLAVACALLSTLLLVGCDAKVCTRHSDCAFGYQCSASGMCEVLPIDAAPEPDADNTDDVTATDGGLQDAPPGDGSSMDASLFDAPLFDAPDASPPADAGIPDSSPSDAPSPDAAGGARIDYPDDLYAPD